MGGNIDRKIRIIEDDADMLTVEVGGDAPDTLVYNKDYGSWYSVAKDAIVDIPDELREKIWHVARHAEERIEDNPRYVYRDGNCDLI